MRINFFIGLICFLGTLSSLAGPVVVAQTSLGSFEIELNEEKAPLTVANFLKYVDEGFYDGTIIHRVVKNFVIQGGGLTSDMTEKPTHDPIVNEATNGLSNLKGTLGMARTDEINSATSQFYINTKDNIRLDHTAEKFGYAVFAKVTSGYDVVESIENVQTHTVGEYENVPIRDVVLISIKRK